MSEITAKGYENLGRLVVLLAEKGLIVKLNQQSSLLTGITVFLKVTSIVNGRSKDITEALGPQALDNINDAATIANAMYEKLRKQ